MASGNGKSCALLIIGHITAMENRGGKYIFELPRFKPSMEMWGCNEDLKLKSQMDARVTQSGFEFNSCTS